MSCEHEFVGKADGVHCDKCGLHLSQAEYYVYLSGGKTPERKPRKAVKKNDNKRDAD